MLHYDSVHLFHITNSVRRQVITTHTTHMKVKHDNMAAVTGFMPDDSAKSCVPWPAEVIWPAMAISSSNLRAGIFSKTLWTFATRAARDCQNTFEVTVDGVVMALAVSRRVSTSPGVARRIS